MTTFPNSPKLLKGGIVLIDPETAKRAADHLAAIQSGLARAARCRCRARAKAAIVRRRCG